MTIFLIFLVYGAGIISSPGETSFLFDRGENNRMVPYNIEEVIETDYPTETFQDKYFVIKDKKQLKESVKFMYNKVIK